MKTIIKYFTVVIAVLLAGGATMAFAGQPQDRSKEREEIKALKIAFMTEELQLTSQESEKFWPIYNKFWKERVVIVKEKSALYKKIEDNQASQQELDRVSELTQQEAEVQGKLMKEISQVISPDKAAKMLVAEEKFKRTLIRRTQNR